MRILVVDDEALARSRLRRMLTELGETEVAEAVDAEAALNAARDFDPELVLLDIAMPGRDGLWVAARLREMGIEAALVFVTAHDEYAVEAFEREARDYLLKPVAAERLARTLERVRNHQQAAVPEQHYLVRQGRGLRRLALAEVWFFKAEDKVVLAFDGEAEHIVGLTLKEIEERYGERFVRIHRSYLVACRHMERLEGDVLGGMRLWLRGYDQPLPVSRRLTPRVRAALNCS